MTQLFLLRRKPRQTRPTKISRSRPFCLQGGKAKAADYWQQAKQAIAIERSSFCSVANIICRWGHPKTHCILHMYLNLAPVANLRQRRVMEEGRLHQTTKNADDTTYLPFWLFILLFSPSFLDVLVEQQLNAKNEIGSV